MAVGHVVKVPFEGAVRIPENEIVSPISASVAPERRLRLPVLSSAMVRSWLTATGAVFVQLIVTVPVAMFEVDPEASRAR